MECTKHTYIIILPFISGCVRPTSRKNTTEPTAKDRIAISVEPTAGHLRGVAFLLPVAAPVVPIVNAVAVVLTTNDPKYFYNNMDDDAPILLGDAPPMENEFAVPPEAEPAYLGEINDAPSAETPIVLMPSGSDDDLDVGGELIDSTSGEPSPMQKWNDEWQQTLMERKELENSRKAELLESARVALEEFAQGRENKRDANMSKNREDEQVKLEAIEADLENDNSWQRVCKMVELSHDSTSEAEDVKRMRDVLILLKNEPARAQALGA